MYMYTIMSHSIMLQQKLIQHNIYFRCLKFLIHLDRSEINLGGVHVRQHLTETFFSCINGKHDNNNYMNN